ncbi:MAG: HIT family protein [Methanobacteriota archaeon]
MKRDKECVFCRIVAGEIPGVKVHEDDRVLAFLDIAPLSRGHTLVIPKTHAARLAELPGPDADALYRAVHALVPRIQRALGVPAANVGVNDGPEAGQAVAHVHAHVIPRTADDGGGSLHSIVPRAARPAVSKEDLAAIAARIRAA